MTETVVRAGLDENPILVEVVRGGTLECVHRGRVVVTRPDGRVLAAWGDVRAVMYPRSSNKPMQAIAMLRHGLDLDGRLLALAAASHGGESFHLDGVREILDGAGLGVDDLQTTPDFPLNEQARIEWIRAGHDKTPLTMNCSGKHAAMLRTCVRAGWDTKTYLEPDHPLQQAVVEVIAEYAGSAERPTVDGCGAPLLGMSLVGLAHAFGRIASGTDPLEQRVAAAYRDFPEYASGTGRDDLALHRAVPGLICKGGAEGCMAIGLPDGHGIAIKSDDGNPRGVAAVAAEVLSMLGHGSEALDALKSVPVLGHGQPVGEASMWQEARDELAYHLS